MVGSVGTELVEIGRARGHKGRQLGGVVSLPRAPFRSLNGSPPASTDTPRPGLPPCGIRPPGVPIEAPRAANQISPG